VSGDKQEKSILRQVFEASTIGINLVISTFVGLGLGYFLDNYLFGKWLKINTSPYLTFIFFFFGVISGFRDVIREAKKQDRQHESDDRKGL
jgi:ATP synthase protein I